VLCIAATLPSQWTAGPAAHHPPNVTVQIFHREGGDSECIVAVDEACGVATAADLESYTARCAFLAADGGAGPVSPLADALGAFTHTCRNAGAAGRWQAWFALGSAGDVAVLIAAGGAGGAAAGEVAPHVALSTAVVAPGELVVTAGGRQYTLPATWRLTALTADGARVLSPAQREVELTAAAAGEHAAIAVAEADADTADHAAYSNAAVGVHFGVAPGGLVTAPRGAATASVVYQLPAGVADATLTLERWADAPAEWEEDSELLTRGVALNFTAVGDTKVMLSHFAGRKCAVFDEADAGRRCRSFVCPMAGSGCALVARWECDAARFAQNAGVLARLLDTFYFIGW
jgi:hypothetical protein